MKLLLFDNLASATPPAPPPSSDAILLENGKALLTESNNELLLDTPVPTVLAEVYGDDWDGSSTIITPTSGSTLTRTGNIVKAFDSIRLGKNAFHINSTGQWLTWDNVLSATKMNYAIFTVARQSGSTSGGNILDFRSAAGTEYKLILTGYRVANDQNGWYYGQASAIADFSVIAGEAMSEMKIRCWLFEDNVGRLFLNGGSVDKTSVFEDTALDTTLKIGGTASVSLDFYIAFIGIYALPLTKKFTASFLDSIGNALQAYYSGGSFPEPIWNPITV